MTLTTEQLKAEMIEKIAVASRLRARDGRNVVAEAIYDEVVAPLLANREAQPVAATPIYQIWDDDGWCDTSELIWRETYDEFRKEQYRIVYTAPPAPAVPPAPANAQAVAWEMRYWNSGYNCWHDWERITAEQHAEMSVKHATDNDYEFRVLYDAPPAPAAPEKCPEHVRFLMSMHADDLFDDADA
ncbi:hypothetical protein [Serratia marcescens]|uniref:hypothetical protein n=1 Tax=Serratia marcescens TaxID=615 RepID=UPI0013788B75|nr:hypothetical protein [Serratia marcescens]MBH3207559.1 hypothetical protein [Serratia marcescens]NCI54410.1 hypothetical protein [Serratia marcescens]NDJ05689.1 hypothetical protein [Serratia marcescens]NDJ29971.1 hypothetical protein [Serratia marcescens]NDJ42834.1 hypothetical protein [Serratia marcescens]